MGGPESGSGGQGEDPSDEDWRSKRKHVFVLSEAGKPIYSRYGSVEALSATMGVMTALVSFVQSAGDAIRAIYAGEPRGMRLGDGDWECGWLAIGVSVCLPGESSSQPGGVNECGWPAGPLICWVGVWDLVHVWLPRF